MAVRVPNAFKLFEKMSLKQFVKQFSDERWTIGFIRNSLDSILAGEPIAVDWVRHNISDAWFADPFILDVTADPRFGRRVPESPSTRAYIQAYD